MTGTSSDGQASPTGHAAESVILQYVEPDQPAVPRRGTADLSATEIADTLWLATALARADRPDRAATSPAEPVEDTPPTVTQSSTDGTSEVERETSRPHADPPPEQAPVGPWEDWQLGGHRGVHPTTVEPDLPVVTAPLVWPTAPALPNARLIARALRPLAVTVDSPWRQELDDEATASWAAETGQWLPRWRAAPWRRHEVVLVADTSLSMEIWQPTVREFRDVLRRQGAFRDVRTYSLDFSLPAQKLVLRTEGGAARGWRDLLDPTGRRLVIVMTDTVGAAWHSGVAGRLLAGWGRSMPVVVVQTMGQRLWHWGGLAPRRMRLSADEPGVPNGRLRVGPAEPELGPVPRPSDTDVVIPVLALDNRWLANWARLFAVAGAGWVNLTAVFANGRGELDSDTDKAADLARYESPPDTAWERVRRFRAFASADAFHLAGLLAAAPLNLATISLVQRVLLPGAGLDTQAEVLLGGLLERLPAGPTGADPTSASFDFHEGVREELLQGLFRTDTVRAARLVVGQLGAGNSALRNFYAALDDPNGTSLPDMNPTERHHLRLQSVVLRSLSGPYGHRGHLLAELLAAQEAPQDRTRGSSVHNGGDLGSPGSIQTASRPEETVTAEAEAPPSPVDVAILPGGTDMTAPGRTRPLDVGRPVVNQPRIWGDLMPLRNPDFVGREQLLAQLQQRLAEPGATAVLPEALHGLGGVGKSQTVAEYIYRNAANYDVVWWVAAEHPTQIRNSLSDLAEKLGLTTTGSTETTKAVLEALRQGDPYSRWILVFDNADRPDDIMDFLPRGTGHIVVTSRNSQWAGIARTVEVDLFTRAESTDLLRRRGGEISDVDADRLAEALGDLPLAIEQAATWRAQTGMPVPEYLGLLQDNRTELLQMGTGAYQSSVAAAWNVPLNKLRTDHPEAIAMLEICAFFGPEPISRRLFSGVPDAPVSDALREALSDPIKLNSAIREISRYSLAKIDHRNNTLQLHRLVQAVLKNQVPADSRDDMQHIAHVLLVNGDPNDPDNATNWPRYAELLPHAITSAAVRCTQRWVRALLINLVRYLMNINDYDGGQELARQAWEIWRVEIGESDLQTLTMARHYGVILSRRQDLEKARELNMQTYGLMVAAFGEDHEAVLSVADAVANDLRAQGKFSDEFAMRQKTYDTACTILGTDDPATLSYGIALAGCLRLIGGYFQARDLDEQVYRRRVTALGPNHQRTFLSLDALAMDLRECGLYVEACEMEEQTLVKTREVLGDDHLRTIGALRNLAIARRKAGRVAEALELAIECYERYGRRQGELHLDTVTALMGLAVDLRQTGDLPKSREHGERSRQQYIQIYGPDHPYVHIAGTNLSTTLRLLGDADGARVLNEAALGFYRSAFGPDHPSALVMATNLASDLAALGDKTGAHEMDVDTLERSSRILGEDHPATLAVKLNLSLDLTSLGRAAAAAEMHAEVLEGFQRKLGDDHPATIAAAQKVRANCDTDTMQL